MTPLVNRNAALYEGDITSRPLKVAVIREEFVALTGDALIAVVLNQLLYWTLRVKDFDLLIEEERRFNPECNVSPRHGWIYKSAEDLTAETMLCISRSTMRRYITFLVDKGYVDERPNQKDKFNKTNQYRLCLSKLQEDLFQIGYSLPGFSLPIREEQIEQKSQHNHSNAQNETSMFQNETSEMQNETSNGQNCSLIYLNRDYTEITNRDHTHSACEIKNEDKNFEPLPEKLTQIWKDHVGQEVIHLTKDRTQTLETLFGELFQGNVAEWIAFCKRVKSSRFLMGQGANRWRVSFDWILSKSNTLKILEGNFDNPEVIETKKEENSKSNRDIEKQRIIDGITDPIWQEWCLQLKNELTETQLREISKAQFHEFDGRLVWISSEDDKTLSHIEDLRLQLLSIAQLRFPEARSIRTQKKEEGMVNKTSSSLGGILDNKNLTYSEYSVNGQPEQALLMKRPILDQTSSLMSQETGEHYGE